MPAMLTPGVPGGRVTTLISTSERLAMYFNIATCRSVGLIHGEAIYRRPTPGWSTRERTNKSVMFDRTSSYDSPPPSRRRSLRQISPTSAPSSASMSSATRTPSCEAPMRFPYDWRQPDATRLLIATAGSSTPSCRNRAASSSCATAVSDHRVTSRSAPNASGAATISSIIRITTVSRDNHDVFQRVGDKVRRDRCQCARFYQRIGSLQNNTEYLHHCPRAKLSIFGDTFHRRSHGLGGKWKIL